MPIDYGFKPATDYGTTFDYILDGSQPSSGNTVQTVAEMVSILQAAPASPQITFGVRDTVKYRGSAGLSNISGAAGFPHIISGYGTEKPVFSGGETLTGWTQCTIADEPDLGAGYANIYKATLNKSLIGSGDGWGLNLHEAGEGLDLCQDRPGRSGETDDLFWIGDYQAYNSADNFIVNGSNQITQIDHAAVFSKYTAAQLFNAGAYVYHSPNVVSRVNITAYNGTDTIDVDGLLTQNSVNPFWQNYNLANILPNLQQGQFGFIDNGSTVTVYCYPNDTANLTSNMEYSAHEYGFDITDSTNHLRFQGLQFEQYATASDLERGSAISTITSTLNKKTGIEISNVRVSGLFNGDGSGYGAVYLRNVDDAVLEDFTFERLGGSFGYFIGGPSVNNGDLINQDFAEGLRVRRGYVEKSEQSPFRHYTLKEFAVVDVNAVDCGKAAHANKANFYEQSWRGVIAYPKFDYNQGYVTWQECSELVILGGKIPADNSPNAPGRGIVDQNSTTENPSAVRSETGRVWMINNIITPNPDTLAQTNGINLGSSSSTQSNMEFYIWNNISHGRDYKGVFGSTADSKYNFFTAADDDPNADPTDSVVSVSSVYADAANDDFRIRTDSAVLSTTGFDITSDSGFTTFMSTYFSDVDYDRDMEGEVVDWTTSAPIGNLVNPETYSPPGSQIVWSQFTDAWIERNSDLANAPATTQNLVAVVTFNPSADDLLESNMGLQGFSGSVNNALKVEKRGADRVRVSIEDNTDTQQYLLEAVTPLSAGTEYCVLVSLDCSLSGAGLYLAIIDVATGAVLASASDADNGYTLDGQGGIGYLVGARSGSGTGSTSGKMDRAQLWLEEYIDFSVAANREFVVANGGGLIDPQVLIDEIGTPDVSISGVGLSDTPVNDGDGGAFVKDGTGSIVPEEPTGAPVFDVPGYNNDPSYILGNAISIDPVFTSAPDPAGTFTVFSGALPDGLLLNASTGNISGTPTSSGAVSFGIDCTNIEGSDQTTVSFDVNAAPDVSYSFSSEYLISQPLSILPSVAEGFPAPTYSVTAGSLPAWASLNSSTGEISGTPNALGSVSFTVTASNIVGVDDNVISFDVVSEITPTGGFSSGLSLGIGIGLTHLRGVVSASSVVGDYSDDYSPDYN